MAENEEAEDLLTPGEDNTNADTEKEEAKANDNVVKKKVVKKRATKKKVVKKRAAAKKIVAKKTTAVEAVPSADREVVQETVQGVVEAGGKEGKSESGDSIISDEPLDTAVKGGIKKAMPVTKGPTEIPREEKANMSVEATKPRKSSAFAGFWPKVILWVVVVVAAFMYIRSLAHKGQMVKRNEGTTPAVINQTQVEGTTPLIEENRSSTGDEALNQSVKNEPSSIGKVGEVMIQTESDSKILPAESESQTVVSITPNQEVEGVEKAPVSGGQQVANVPEPAVQEEVSPTVEAGSASKQAHDSVKEPALPIETTGSSGSPGSAVTVTTQIAAEYPPTGAADTLSLNPDPTLRVSSDSERQATPSTADNEASASDEGKAVAQAIPPEASETVAVAEGSADAASAAAKHTEDSSETDMPASTLALPKKKGTEFARDGGRPSFRELFGYERPKPPVHWQDRGPYESSAPDSFEQQEYYPAPWPYMPGQPAWGGGGYPYQYGPYSSYGAYPAYPGMPDWAPYRPYGYGSGY